MINSQEFFTHALHDSEAVTDLLANDGGEPNIFEYPCEEELGDNPGKPYIVVQNTGTTSESIDKDMDSFDPMNDQTTIEVTIVASNKSDAKAVAFEARNELRSAMDQFGYQEESSFGFRLEDSKYSDRGVQFDVESGNYFVTMTYLIETSK